MADSKTIVGKLIQTLREAAPELDKETIGGAIQAIRDAVEAAMTKGSKK